MTAFEDAARAEAEALFLHSAEVPSPQDLGVHMATWARRYEAGREVTDAEVKVVARAIFEVRDDAYDLDEWEELTSADREPYECDARAALTAARAVRLAEMEDV